ncbi:MAG: molybdopterin-dependent oxidoreductase, partial [Dehalococcoidia bacterium]|nr:molybdopterin-dependent oxidoreductase [Dehalococcoidia bacterium]
TALFNAMARVIIEEGLEARDLIEMSTEGFEEFRASVQEFTPERAEEITGVPAEDIVAAAREYATTKPAAIIYTMGVTQHICGVQNVQSLSNLALLCGNFGRANSGVNPLRGQNNVQGACDMGCGPVDLPGYQKIANDDVRRKWEEAWGVTLPARPGVTKVAAIDEMLEGRVKAAYIMGENVLVSEADASKAQRALESLDLLVVQDLFLTETARLADVVLPAASFAESDGTITNTERRVQRVRKAVDPPGSAREDWRILAELSTRLGYRMDYEDVSQVWDEMAALTSAFTGISYERLEGEGIQWPCPTPDHPGTPYLHSELWQGKQTAYFRPVGYTPPAEQPDDEFPLVLTTGRRLPAYHTHTQTGRSAAIRLLLPRETVEINPVDGQRLGIEDGQKVRVVSRRGEVTAAARLTERSPVGVVFLSFHFPEQALTNVLTNDAYDPVAQTPEYKACAVRIERA